MTTTPDNAATTWRDLADQLTPEQVAYLELSECHPVPMADGTFDPERERCGHLFGAREMAAQNLAAMLYQHIPTAAGAEDIGPWQQFDDDGSWSRVWWGVRRLVPIASAGTHDFEVFVQGTQWSDGRGAPASRCSARRGRPTRPAGRLNSARPILWCGGSGAGRSSCTQLPSWPRLARGFSDGFDARAHRSIAPAPGTG